jgi:hypothetical protein
MKTRTTGILLAIAVLAANVVLAQSNPNSAIGVPASGAELVRNHDFEGGTNDLPGWSLIAEGGGEGEISLCADLPRNESKPHSLRLTVTKHQQRAGVANGGFGGIKIVAGDWYDLTFYARTETNKHFGLIVSLESLDGRKVCSRATLPEVGGEWKPYQLALQARESDPRTRLIIAMPEPGTVWFDDVSLLPRKASGNRPDAGAIAPESRRENNAP